MRTMVRVCAVVVGIGLALGGAAQGAIVMSSNVPMPVPDNNPAGVTSTLVFPSMTIGDVDLILFATHSSVPDLHIELTSPSGTTAVLVSAFTEGGIFVGLGTPDNFFDTHLDDDAPINLRNGSAPYTGHYNIVWPGNDLLSVFDGEDAGGRWTLFVSDLAGFDVGTIDQWGLEIVPEPATMTLLGLGIGGLLAARRKRK